MDCSFLLFARLAPHKTSTGEGEGREEKESEVKHFEKKWEREYKIEDKDEENKKGTGALWVVRSSVHSVVIRSARASPTL